MSSALSRAILVVAGLCLAALALALGSTIAVERAHPGITRAPRDLFLPLPILKLDVNQGISPGNHAYALAVARVSGIGLAVNLGGGAAGAGLEAQLEAVRDGHELAFANLDPDGCCGKDWIAREAERVGQDKRSGARGLAILEEPRGAQLTRSPDSAPLWEACARNAYPVILGEVGTLDERVRLAERYPGVAFVLTTAWREAGDGHAVAQLMDRLPNLWVDTSDLLAGPAEVPGAREAILAHPDRVLFGSGVRYVESGDLRGIELGAGQAILLDEKLLGGKERQIFFLSIYRYLETRDQVRGLQALPGDPGFTGLGLSRKVLLHLYRENAERLLRVRVPEEDE